MPEIILLTGVAVFLAFNMGASGIAPSFCSIYGAKFITRGRMFLLFGLFVILGAAVGGHKVVKTISGGIIPARHVTMRVAIVILTSATVSLFMANVLKVPQSTSQVTVFSLVAAGMYFGGLNLKKFYVLIPAWIILPALSYFLSLYLHKFIYPPRKENFRLYERIFMQENNLKRITVLMSCYVAFAIGTNNVANVVGPLTAANVFSSRMVGMMAIAPLFGIGALLFGRGNLSAFGCDIIPLGIATSVIAGFVTATLLIGASLAGIPQSLVQLNAASIFAVSHVKDGFGATASNSTTRRAFFIWLITPVLSFVITFVLLHTCGVVGINFK